MTFTEFVDALLAEKGWSRRYLAKVAEIPPSTLQSALERGGGLTVERLQKIADALDISTDTLLGRNQPLAEAPAAPADEMNRLLAKLNSDGQKVAIERVEELTEIPKYQRKKPDD